MAGKNFGVGLIWSAASIKLDHSDDIRIVDHRKPFGLDNGSIVFTFTTDDVRTTQGLLSKDANGRGGDGDLSVWLRHGQVYARIEAEGRTYKISGGEIEAGKPAAVAVTFGDEGLRLFVDGKLVGQNDYRGGIQGNTEDFVIGALNDESKSGTTHNLTREFRGEIEEIGVYRDALSVEAIRAHAEGQGVPKPNPKPENDMNLPQAFWALDDVRIDGLDDARVIPHKNAFVLDDGTLAFAVTPDSVGGRQGLISKDADFFGTGGHLTVWLNNGKIVARLQSESRSYEIEGGKIAAGEATDVAVTFGSGGFKLYVDGKLVDSHGYTGGLQGNTEPLVIGASQWGSSEDEADKLTHEFMGTLSDVGFYSKALSKKEIAALAESGSADPQPEQSTDPESGAPVITDPIGSIEIGENQRMRWELSDYFSDPDGDALSYKLQGAPGFVSINGQGRLIVNTDGNDAGLYEFNITASDGSTSSAPLAVKLKVGDVADDGGSDPEPQPAPGTGSGTGAPVISDPIGTIEIGESQRMRWELSDYFSDPDGDALNYKLQGAPDFVSINGQGRLIVNTADGDDGSYSFTIAATDGKSTSAPFAVKLNVADSMNSGEPSSGGAPEPAPGTGNEAPVVSDPLGTIAIDEGTKRKFDLGAVFSDSDGDPLDFVLSGDPDFIWINSNNQLVIDARDGDDGRYDFKVTASDGAADISTNVSVRVADTIDGSGDGGSGGGSGNFTPNSLIAKNGILTNGKIGTQEWGDDVTLTGYDVHGKLAEVRWDPSEFDGKELGFGVKGKDGRWDTQIDYFEWDGGARSEKLIIDFNGDVTDVILRASMMGLTEGGDDQMETGLWRAYNDAGKLVGKGLIGPDQSMLGFDRKGTPIKEDGTYGAYPIEIDPGVAFQRLEIEATQFDHDDGHSFKRPYGENSSDFGIMGIDYLRLEPADDFLF